MSEAWRDGYDGWKLRAPDDEFIYTGTHTWVEDEDGELVDAEELAAREEDAAIEKAERQREDEMFDRDSWEDW